MKRPFDFSGHAHRCLFRNDCIQAHLLGLTANGTSFESCLSQSATIIVTYGEACARIADQETQLRVGDQVEVPCACSLRLFTYTEADVMLLIKPRKGEIQTPDAQ